MEIESPMDAMMTFFAVSIISIALLGVALGIQATATPDANAAVETIDSTATTSSHQKATYEHNGEQYWMDTQQIALKNDGGKQHASITFGEITPVYPADAESESTNEKLFSVLQTGDWEAEFEDETAFVDAAESARQDSLETQGQWRPASGELTVRRLTVDNEEVTLVTA